MYIKSMYDRTMSRTGQCREQDNVANRTMSRTGQCREQDNVASLRVLGSKQVSLFVVATRFAICDIILSATLSYHTL